MSVKPTIVELILNATAAGKSMLSAASAAAQKTLLALVKGDVGLGNVDNTSDSDKPVSTAQQTALDAKIGGSTGSTDNRVLRSDGTGAATAQNSPVTIDDSGNISGAGTVGCGTLTTTGDIITPGIASFASAGVRCGGLNIGRGANVAVSGDQVNMYSNFVRKLSMTPSFNMSSDVTIGFRNNVANNTGAIDCMLLRNGTGQLATVSDSGLAIRNFANSADAALTASSITASGLMSSGIYTFATVPSASSNTGKFLRISDRAQKHAYSDGTNWRFFGDDAIIS